MRIELLLAVAFALPAQASMPPLFEAEDFSPVFAPERPARVAQVPEFKFRNQSGREISRKDLEGQLTLVNFFFTQCNGICPMLMKNLKALHRSIQAEVPGVRFMSFSITPEYDTPERLRKFARESGVDLRSWDLVTGDTERLLRFARDTFKADKETRSRKADQFVHSETVFLIDRAGRIRGFYSGQKPVSLRLAIQDARDLSVGQ